MRLAVTVATIVLCVGVDGWRVPTGAPRGLRKPATSQPIPRRCATTMLRAKGDDNASVVDVAPFSPDTAPTLQEQLDLFWRLAVPYFERAEGAKEQFALLILLTLVNSGVSVLFSFVSRDFYSTLGAKDLELFQQVTVRFAAAAAAAVPLVVLYKFQRARLALKWREWMTTELTNVYYSDRAYYKLELERQKIDNPDQRITEDVRAFTRVSLDFFITLVTSVIDLVSFSGILYSIYPNLFYAIFLYAGVGSASTVYLGRALVGQNAEQLLREADLRYSLVRLRDNAESVAFYGGEEQEASEITSRLASVVDNLKQLIGTQRNLEFFTVGYRYLVQILPVLVVAPLYFAGSIELGVITQSSGAFNHVLSDLSILVNEFESLSSFSAGLNRLSAFVSRMETLAPPSMDGVPPASPFNLSASIRTTVNVEAGTGHAEHTRHAALTVAGRVELVTLPAATTWEPWPPLSVHELSLSTPDGTRTLFRNVSVGVRPNEHLLITGRSGAGKSSLLRAIAGLWDNGEGVIKKSASTMFLPQRPYCTIGALRQQLLYPVSVNSSSAPADDVLIDALRTVQLGGLVTRYGLDVERDWGDMLSLGEQQRLAFARVIISQPALLLLDEATSALDLDNEAAMYEALARLPGLTYISVGHRPSLLRFHRKRLRLHGADAQPAYKLECVEDEELAGRREY
jgi:putative ATP-binding cassette transporter